MPGPCSEMSMWLTNSSDGYKRIALFLLHRCRNRLHPELTPPERITPPATAAGVIRFFLAQPGTRTRRAATAKKQEAECAPAPATTECVTKLGTHLARRACHERDPSLCLGNELTGRVHRRRNGGSPA